VQIELNTPAEMQDLMTAEQYQEFLAAEAE